MSHRRLYETDTHWTIRETGSGRDVAIVPKDATWECLHPAERTAREIKHLPAILDHLRHRAFHGDTEAERLLLEIDVSMKN